MIEEEIEITDSIIFNGVFINFDKNGNLLDNEYFIEFMSYEMETRKTNVCKSCNLKENIIFCIEIRYASFNTNSFCIINPSIIRKHKIVASITFPCYRFSKDY